jgi:hypothetical protein
MTMNRHERRRSLKRGTVEVKMLRTDQIMGRQCCFNGCGKIFNGDMPKGWQAIIMFGDPKPSLRLDEIKDWKRDGVLCPEHAEAVQDLLFPLGTIATMASKGTA